MTMYPHDYAIAMDAAPNGDVELRGEGLPVLLSAPPVQFGGPGGRWSPETLLVAAVGDCLVLTFRAIARAMELPWISLHCEVRGTLDRLDRVTQFAAFEIRAQLRVPPGLAIDTARLALEKAERACLITNSLKAPCRLEIDIEHARIDDQEQLAADVEC